MGENGENFAKNRDWLENWKDTALGNEVTRDCLDTTTMPFGQEGTALCDFHLNREDHNIRSSRRSVSSGSCSTATSESQHPH